MACKHSDVMHHGWHPSGYWYEAPYLARHQADGALCLSCHAWLPLGPTPPDTEAVAVEKRAAELAAMTDTALAQAFKLPRNWDHWLGWHYYDEEDFALNPSELAGYLARCIREHDAEQGSE